MLEQIVVDEAVRRLRPDFAVLAVVARRVRGGPSDDASRAPAGLPEINRLVDAYNAVSVRHGLPVGGEDLDAYRGAARLVRAAGDDLVALLAAGSPGARFETRLIGPASDPVGPAGLAG